PPEHQSEAPRQVKLVTNNLDAAIASSETGSIIRIRHYVERQEGNLMAIQITHRKEDEVPTPGAFGRVNEDLEKLKAEMRNLGAGMVFEIETGNEKAVRGAKMLITK